MYEKTINNTIMTKATPVSCWEPLDHRQLNERLVVKDAAIERLEYQLTKSIERINQLEIRLRAAKDVIDTYRGVSND